MVVRTIKSEVAYQKHLKEFMQKINPKPSPEEVEQLKADLLKEKKRECKLAL